MPYYGTDTSTCRSRAGVYKKEENVMRPEDLILRGFTKLDGDSYFSICLDLNIYARGDTPEQATDKCLGFVCEYIEEAYSEDIEHFSDLVPRKAPLRFWVEYRFMRLVIQVLSRFHAAANKPKNVGPFKRPLPMRLAC